MSQIRSLDQLVQSARIATFDNVLSDSCEASHRIYPSLPIMDVSDPLEKQRNDVQKFWH